MSDDKPIESKAADDLIKTKKPGDVQLSEEELKQVSGGIVGESTDAKHKGEIE